MRYVFFFNDTATTEIYTLSLHDALPIYSPTVSTQSVGHTPFSPSILALKDGRILSAGFMRDIKAIHPEALTVSDFPFNQADWERCIRRKTFIPTDLYQDMGGQIWIGTDSNG